MQSFVEGLKEAGRVVLLALVSYLLSAGVLYGLLAHYFGLKVDAATLYQATAVLTVVLKSFDAYLHQVGTSTSNQKLVTGLTRF